MHPGQSQRDRLGILGTQRVKLGHASLATTEKHYQQAQSLSAHREYVETMRKRKTPP